MNDVTRRVLGGAFAAMLASTHAVSAAPMPLRIRRGVNLWPWFSLTREYPAPRTDYAWPPFQSQRPVPHPADLVRLREAGFDFVRLPVDPGPFLAASADRRDDLMALLSAATEAIRNAGLKLVLNLQPNEATHHWVSQLMVGGPDAPALPLYRALVRDVARLLARADLATVALEPMNEPSDACEATTWPVVQADLFAAAREVAPTLTLVATGACGSMIRGLTALDPAGVAAFAPVLYTFHFYEPYLFSHQGAPWMRQPVYRDLNAVPWPGGAGTLEATLAAVRTRMAGDAGRSTAEKAAAYAETERVLGVYFAARPDRGFVDHYLDQVVSWAQRHRIAPDHILMGEFGALRSDTRYVAAPAADRARYVGDVREAAEAHGFPWAFWNLFDGMGVMDDATRAFDPPILKALGLRLPPP